MQRQAAEKGSYGQIMKVRSRAPLRIGFAGGGTDLSPYCDQYGGAILNATISLYASTTIESRDDGRVRLVATDIGQVAEFDASGEVPMEEPLLLHRAVYRRIVETYNNGEPLPCTITTFCDAPPGSGLGSSSTMVVSMLKAFVELLSLPLGEYDIGHLAYVIERVELGLQGGRQDQYAATFGGFNYMEFYADDRVIVNPLRIKNWVLSELESTILLFYTGVSRSSADIIRGQTDNVKSGNSKSLDALHKLKEDAIRTKECLLKGDVLGFARVVSGSWEAKKNTAAQVSNSDIDRVFESAIAAGAIGGKISGAGGGGFITFFAEPERRLDVIRALEQESGQIMPAHFTKDGTLGWRL